MLCSLSSSIDARTRDEREGFVAESDYVGVQRQVKSCAFGVQEVGIWAGGSDFGVQGVGLVCGETSDNISRVMIHDAQLSRVPT